MWVESDSPVRLIDLVVEEFIRGNEAYCTWGGKSNAGCRSYSPSTMLKLLLYCYFNWIPGSRRMEKETYRNIEVIWLLGDLKPDFWTICYFRKENRELIRSAALALRKFLLSEGYADGKTIVFDGSKMKASAGWLMRSDKQLKSRIDNIEQTLEKYLENTGEIDELEDRLEKESQDNEELMKRVDELEKEKAKLEELRNTLAGSSKKYVSPTDPDASLMKSRDGNKPCYNVQTGVDARHHMIILAEVTSKECDFEMLKPDFESVKEQLKIIPHEIEADTGYGNVDQIREIEESSSTICAIPIQEPLSKKKDKENGIEFKYDSKTNSYKCPNGRILHSYGKNSKRRRQLYNLYRCYDCSGCPIKDKCTSSPKGRSIRVNVNQKWIDSYKARLNKEENIRKIKQRKTIVEHPFGTIKMMMGKMGFLLRSKCKVQVEVDLYTTVYNLKRLITIENMESLMIKVRTYAWGIA
jgi:transposase